MNTGRHISQIMEERCYEGGLYVDHPSLHVNSLFGYRQQFFLIEDFVPGAIFSEIDPTLAVDPRGVTLFFG